MATGDEEIIRSVSDQRTTTNNESLKRYLFVVYIYHRYPETKNIFFWKQENSIFFLDIVVRSNRAHIILRESYYKVFESVYLPTGLFYSQDSVAENGKQKAKSRCVVILPTRTWRMSMDSNQSKLNQKNRSRSTCKHDRWKKIQKFCL